MTLVSVIIPTRNRPSMLLRALHSVLSQGIRNIEIIIVDSSDDDYRLFNYKVVKAVKENVTIAIRYTYLPPTSPSKARNLGIRISSGEYVALLDDDDYWLSSKLSIQLKLAKKYNFMATGYILMLDEFNRRKILDNKIPKISNPHKDILKANFIATSTVFVEKDMLLKAKCFNEELYNLEDWDCWIRLLKLPDINFHLIPTPLAVISQYSSFSTGKSRELSKSILKFLGYHFRELDRTTTFWLLLQAYEHLIVRGYRNKDLEKLIHSLKPQSFLLGAKYAVHRAFFIQDSRLLKLLWLINDRSYGFIKRIISLII
jgi:glycosyltransferase involved in cell wall biosynthesis